MMKNERLQVRDVFHQSQVMTQVLVKRYPFHINHQGK